MYGDLQRGNRLELLWLQGTVSQLGRDHTIATPANDFVGDVLALYADGAPAAAAMRCGSMRALGEAGDEFLAIDGRSIACNAKACNGERGTRRCMLPRRMSRSTNSWSATRS
jgi:hypothetical protein